MPLIAKLQPISGGTKREILVKGLSSRPTISITQETKLNVGRGAISGIADQDLVQYLFTLAFDANGQLTATLIGSTLNSHAISINSNYWKGAPSQRRVLQHGDIISLNASAGRKYNYQVFIEQQSASNNTKNQSIVELLSQTSSGSSDGSSSNTSPLPFSLFQDSKPAAQPAQVAAAAPASGGGGGGGGGVMLSSDCKERISDELSCPVCLEIQVCSHTLVPCGHSFCSPCLTGLEQCPQCRTDITQFVPARQLDSLISHLTSVGGLLCADDIEHYQKRRQEAPTAVTFKAGVKRARQEGNTPSRTYRFSQGSRAHSAPVAASNRAAGNNRHGQHPSSLMARLGFEDFVGGEDVPPFGGLIEMLQAERSRLQSQIQNREQQQSQQQRRRRQSPASSVRLARGSNAPTAVPSLSLAASRRNNPAVAGGSAAAAAASGTSSSTGATVDDAICID